MNYVYKSFAFICTSLAAVTEEFVSKTNSSFEMFENIILQRLEKSSYEDDEVLSKLYNAWSLDIIKLVADAPTGCKTDICICKKDRDFTLYLFGWKKLTQGINHFF